MDMPMIEIPLENVIYSSTTAARVQIHTESFTKKGNVFIKPVDMDIFLSAGVFRPF